MTHDPCGTRRAGRLPVLVVLTFVLWWADPASAALIKLRETATVAGTLVRLGDVAEVRDVDPELTARLQNVVLMPAPPVDRPVKLDFDAIRTRLRAVGQNLQHLEFSGASSVLVSAPPEVKEMRPVVRPAAVERPANSRQLDQLSDQVTNCIIAFASQREPDCEWHTSLRLTEGHYRILSGTDPATWQIRCEQMQSDVPQLFEISLTTATGEARTTVVTATVSKVPRVLTVLQPVAKGKLLQMSDLAWLPMQAEDLDGEMLAHPDLVLGMEVVRALRPGLPIRTADVRRKPLVRTGEIVTVSVDRPGIRIRMEAKARGTGGIGETITVVTLDGRETLQARVSGLHEAMLALDASPKP